MKKARRILKRIAGRKARVLGEAQKRGLKSEKLPAIILIAIAIFFAVFSARIAPATSGIVIWNERKIFIAE